MEIDSMKQEGFVGKKGEKTVKIGCGEVLTDKGDYSYYVSKAYIVKR